MVKRLYRSESDRMVAGVLGGLATYFNIDSTIVRLLFIVGLFMSVFALTLFYLSAVIIIPNEGDIHERVGRWLMSRVLNAIALIVTAQLFAGFHLEGFQWALLASAILAVLNTIVKPILLFLTLPITFVTLGLFLFVINAVTL